MAEKSILKLTMTFLLLSGLFYSSTRVASYNPIELSSEFPAYPPPGTPSSPQTGNEIALPLIMNFSHTAPHYTASLYFNTVNPSVMYTQGCITGDKVKLMEGEQDSAVIINFCQPWEYGGIEGVWLCVTGDSQDYPILQ